MWHVRPDPRIPVLPRQFVASCLYLFDTKERDNFYTDCERIFLKAQEDRRPSCFARKKNIVPEERNGSKPDAHLSVFTFHCTVGMKNSLNLLRPAI